MCKTSASSRNFTPQLIRLAQSSKSNSAVKANPPKISQIDTLIIFSIEKSGFITVQSSDFLRFAFHIKNELKLLQTNILHKQKMGCTLLTQGWRIHDDLSKCVHKITTFQHIKPAFKPSLQNPSLFAHRLCPPFNNVAFKPLRPRGQSHSGKLCFCG